ncbi:DUF4974 domain-containing protein [Chitinophaga silvatica]|uniref:DUF4974 domain-containing protein n=1 Tax=Chitinophaga silvatica TaxID=2282649 RepID=A0A3E1YAV0_9BACT|nr:FecR domain-containing protein [Chitinophaga silvatica]RFS22788.1 DUF4974 domain-containing protein [Chitinophaga silvatica]
MEEKKHSQRFEDASENFLNDWIDHLANSNPFPGEMPAGKEKEQLRKQMLMEIKRRTGLPVHRQSKSILGWSIAATILVLISLGGLQILLQRKPIQYVRLTTATGERKLITLPDHSSVWLGPASSIEYAEKFAANREVKLVYGEAFFDVSKDDDHPFNVMVDSLKVDVLGTSFNIQAFKKHDIITIGVSTGKVRVGTHSKVFGYLTAKDQIQILKDDYSFNIHSMPSLEVDGLRNNRINFEDMPLTDVLSMLESYYPITFQSKDTTDIRISGSFSMKLQPNQVVKVLQQLVEKQVDIQEMQPGIYTVRLSINKN